MCSITVSTSSIAKITSAVAKTATTAIGTSTMTTTATVAGAEKLNPFGSESIKMMMTKDESM